MKRLIAAALTATTMTLAACTATTGTDPSASAIPSTTPQTSTAEPSTPDPVSSWLFGTTTTSSAPTSTSTTSTAGSSTGPSTSVTTGDVYDAIPVTIPSTITGAGLKSAKAAIPVWRNAVRLYNESMQKPGDDWKAKIRKYVGDPAAITQLTLLASFAKDGVHQIGALHYAGEVTEATAHNVEIRACVDISSLNVVNRVGDSVLEPNTPARFYREYNIDFYPNAGHVWLLNFITTPKPAQTC